MEWIIFSFVTFFKVYLFILRERERKTVSRGKAERENPKQAPHQPAEPYVRLGLMNREIMT